MGKKRIKVLLADFTHGICPECARRLYSKIYKEKRKPRKPRSPKKRWAFSVRRRSTAAVSACFAVLKKGR